jgi:hypothetical protein
VYYLRVVVFVRADNADLVAPGSEAEVLEWC